MEYNKKISRSGSITLPAALRREYGIEPGEPVNISMSLSGKIVIKRITGACVFCKSETNLKLYNSRYVCSECINKIRKV